ncbi:TetR family transcriptional regulator [Klebsiella pneumoniae]|uniref:TetR family transcriptional regulator n=1 Tax=Enterobacteriaceae TaxID=543 RepID=UPI001159D389|nr:TetR family transcriptional regulator [Klebsiella pneumoniae]ELY2785158.1 TetR family transcriptional regulator [Cronobacter turicensis]ELA0994040.1 TetR family transcriptional regulator [Klebsiella pneumoniae]MCU8675172.1 TetR family transcriptional regulator [Klebsiella pneumoniae]MCU8688531.1 TetR family transcriptional regulator [Klebsiella pneumoniae]HBR3463631.1 TetR family transcriptional regulator [Klebsiella pneumoniae]
MAYKNPSLRERHKEITRRELSNLGLELFIKQGFNQTTIEHIVEPLGVARRTFFRYFKTKEDLIFLWHDDKTVELVNELRRRPDHEGPLEAVRETLATTLLRYDANPDMAFALVRLLKETPALLAKECEKRMEREVALATALMGRASETGLSMLKARIIVGAVTSAWTAALDEWYADGGNQQLRPIMARAFSMVGEL